MIKISIFLAVTLRIRNSIVLRTACCTNCVVSMRTCDTCVRLLISTKCFSVVHNLELQANNTKWIELFYFPPVNHLVCSIFEFYLLTKNWNMRNKCKFIFAKRLAWLNAVTHHIQLKIKYNSFIRLSTLHMHVWSISRSSCDCILIDITLDLRSDWKSKINRKLSVYKIYHWISMHYIKKCVHGIGHLYC